MAEVYKMKIAGVDCELKKFPVNDKVEIAAFILFDNVEVTIKSAEELQKRVPEYDIIVTPEAKSIPLAYEMAKQNNKPYVVLRKGLKVYMRDPICSVVNSITTDNVQELYIGQDDVDRIKGKRVLLLDDVISTGDSIRAAMQILDKINANVVATCAVLAEGDAAKRDDIIFLEELPLFIK